MQFPDRGSARALSATLVAVTALGLSGCTGDDPVPADGESPGTSAEAPEGTPTEENRVVYEGQYNQEFIDESANYVGQQVTVSGEVSQALSPETFAIAGPTSPMLIVGQQEIPAVNEGESAEITGTMRDSFSVTGVEEELAVDLQEELYTEFEGEDYVMATEVQAGDQG